VHGAGAGRVFGAVGAAAGSRAQWHVQGTLAALVMHVLVMWLCARWVGLAAAAWGHGSSTRCTMAIAWVPCCLLPAAHLHVQGAHTRLHTSRAAPDTAYPLDLTLCAPLLPPPAQMDKDDKVKTSALNCLQQYKDELRSDKCKAQIHRITQRASRDIRFDEMLASACTEDRNKYCQDIQPGSARVIRCLQVSRAQPGLADHITFTTDTADTACTSWLALWLSQSQPH
jgi:hypothetical protein